MTNDLTRYPFNRWIDNSDIPIRFRGKTIDNPGVREFADKYIAGIRDGAVIKAEGQEGCGKGILIFGNPGVGKSTTASVILSDLIERIPRHVWGDLGDTARIHSPVMFLTYPRYMALMGDVMDKDDEDQRKIAKATLRRARGMGSLDNPLDVASVLVIDDLGKEYATEWSREHFDHLLRNRFDAGLPTIVTTNVSPSKWEANYGEAAADFAREAFIHLEMMGGSRR